MISWGFFIIFEETNKNYGYDYYLNYFGVLSNVTC